MSHDNKSKNYPIVFKFGTDVAFIYHQIEFVAKKYRSSTKQKKMRLKIKKKILIAFTPRILDLSTWNSHYLLNLSWDLAQMQLLYIFRSSSLPQKNVPLRKKIFQIKNYKKKFESHFLREYLIYQLEILTSYCTNYCTIEKINVFIVAR